MHDARELFEAKGLLMGRKSTKIQRREKKRFAERFAVLKQFWKDNKGKIWPTKQ